MSRGRDSMRCFGSIRSWGYRLLICIGGVLWLHKCTVNEIYEPNLHRISPRSTMTGKGSQTHPTGLPSFPQTRRSLIVPLIAVLHGPNSFAHTKISSLYPVRGSSGRLYLHHMPFGFGLKLPDQFPFPISGKGCILQNESMG
jgi:hypothetical protein